jgi:2-polyprenyl-3-methyl-5-hydroxy-6-metoxy-1,4-benzoquinol methylase
MSEYRYTDAPHSGHSDYLIRPVLRAMETLPRGASVADFGCGDGEITRLLAAPGRRLCGFDSSTTGIARASARWPEIAWECRDLTAPMNGHAFDCIVSIEVIEHVYSPRDFIANCTRALKPGGLLILTTPYHGYLKNLIIAATGKFDAHTNPLWDHGHIKFWSRTTLTQLLDESGYTNIRFEGAGRLPYLWRSMAISAIQK